jgi:hypothetical protein
MARAAGQHKTKSAKRTSRRKTRPGAFDVLLKDVFPLEPNKAWQRLTALKRQWPAMPVLKWGLKSKSGEILPLERIGLSVGIDATGVDTLEIRDTHYSHPALDEPVEFYARSTDTADIERMEFLESDNDVNRDYGDYDPVERFEREWKEQPRTPPRPYPAVPAAPETAPAVSEVATQDVSREVQGVDPFRTGAAGRPSAAHLIEVEAGRRITNKEVTPTLGGLTSFSEDLETWWEKERHKPEYNPPGPPMKAGSIKNVVRKLWTAACGAPR